MMRRWWNALVRWLYGEAILRPLQENMSDNFNSIFAEIDEMKSLQEERLGRLVIAMEDLNEEIEKMKMVVQERLPVNWDTIFPRGPKAFTHENRQ